ncbi:MAG: glycosyltransferase family 4 protein [Pirellulales bacterium]|nr:glycosyltransferase family 4 protein [Pirellulales bacterium]
MRTDSRQDRILHILPQFSCSGMGSRLLGLSREATRDFPQPEFLAWRGVGPWRQRFLQTAPTWAACDRTHDGTAWWRYGQILRKIRPDLIHFWGGTNSRAIWLARQIVPGVQIIATCNQATELSQLDKRVPWPWARSYLPDEVAIESECLAERYISSGQNIQRSAAFSVRVIPAAAPPRLDSAAANHQAHTEQRLLLRQKLNIPPTAPVLLTVGPLTAEKRIVELLWSLDQVNCVLSEVYLLIVGEGPARDLISKYARLFHIDQRVRFLDYQPNLDPPLAAADLYLTADPQLGPKQAIMEAQDAGLPIIGHDQPELRRLCRPGVDAILCRSDMRAELAGALYRLLSHPEKYAQLRAAASKIGGLPPRQQAWEAYAEGYSRLYKELLAVRTIPLHNQKSHVEGAYYRRAVRAPLK